MAGLGMCRRGPGGGVISMGEGGSGRRGRVKISMFVRWDEEGGSGGQRMGETYEGDTKQGASLRFDSVKEHLIRHVRDPIPPSPHR